MLVKDLPAQTAGHDNPSTVDKREKLSRREFLEEYVIPSRPVILTDAVQSWRGFGVITPDFFKKNYGHYTRDFDGVTYTYAELMDKIVQSTPENPAPYPFNVNVEKVFPELMKLFRPDIPYGKIDRINHPLLPRLMTRGTEVYEFFMGGNGSSFPFLHIDELYLHNQMTQLYGSKEFILFPPDQTPYLYPTEKNPKVSPVDVFRPDYEKFPLFRQAKPMRVTVLQGETLFFPTGWWHSTRIYEPCISLGRNHLNRANFSKFIGDEYKVWKQRSAAVAAAVLIYGKLLGSLMNVQEMLV